MAHAIRQTSLHACHTSNTIHHVTYRFEVENLLELLHGVTNNGVLHLAEHDEEPRADDWRLAELVRCGHHAIEQPRVFALLALRVNKSAGSF